MMHGHQRLFHGLGAISSGGNVGPDPGLPSSPAECLHLGPKAMSAPPLGQLLLPSQAEPTPISTSFLPPTQRTQYNGAIMTYADTGPETHPAGGPCRRGQCLGLLFSNSI